ncbi:MAG: VWA domain-containing protein, partial [Victivallales bacterium]|nr:VWA domain-containing protein [Victivallales bacterium]
MAVVADGGDNFLVAGRVCLLAFPAGGDNMNPVMMQEYLVPAAVAVLLFSGFFSWRGTATLPPVRRGILLTLRLLGMAGAIGLLFNFGERCRINAERSERIILLDRSASMAVRDVNGRSRWDQVRQTIAAALAARRSDAPRLRLHTFSSHLEGEITPEQLSGTRLVPDGDDTDIDGTAAAVLDPAFNASVRPSGLVICSDGRQVAARRNRDFPAYARAGRVEIAVLPVGTTRPSGEFLLTTGRSHYLAFVGQTVTVPVRVNNRNRGRAVVTVELTDAGGKVLQSLQLQSEPGRECAGAFRVTAEREGVRLYGLRWAAVNGCSCRNPRQQIAVTAIGGRLKLLLLEGCPGWDTKFLAQILRQSSHLDLTVANRVGNGNFLVVENGHRERPVTPEAIIPDDPARLAEYQIIIFGKGAEYFLSPAKVAVLRRYLADGGVILMARGKPYAGKLPGLEDLEPVVWGEPVIGSFRWRPVGSGGDEDIFGSCLPAANAPIWRQLPVLNTANWCRSLRPPARVLIHGESVNAGTERSFPVLALRHYGRGISAVLNSDGLWQWGFRPMGPECEKFYRDFWMQLILWLAKSGDFLPGKDLALTLEATVVAPQQVVTAGILDRSRTMPRRTPVIRIFRHNRLEREISAASAGDGTWTGALRFAVPGFYLVTAMVPGGGERMSVSRLVRVKAPPREDDDLTADPAYLAQLAATAGGKVLTAPELTAWLNRRDDPAVADSLMTQWRSTWDRWWWLLLLLVAFS